jgi:acyl dehydratase
MDLASLAGFDLGTRCLQYTEEDTILYALAVGARVQDLDLVYERSLRALPTLALALGCWAPDEVGLLGAYEKKFALHGAQSLRMKAALPPAGELVMAGRVADVWDKGRSAVVDVEVTSDYFTAVYALFVRGHGGWGGARGPATEAVETTAWPAIGSWATTPEQAALYRLTGDHHLIHIDPQAARIAGLERPILHGLCTLGAVARQVSSTVGAHPADLRELHARFAAPVIPGDVVDVVGRPSAGGVGFEARVGERAVLTAGRAAFQVW